MVLAVLVSMYVSISTLVGLLAHLVLPTFSRSHSQRAHSAREKARKIEGDGVPHSQSNQHSALDVSGGSLVG
jgi:hypothetical protein